jgi:transposase
MKKLSMNVLNPHAAGIDVGSRSHMVAVDQDPAHVCEFGVYTGDHKKLVAHLQQFGVTTIAMESTGSYWQTLFNALQAAGFEVLLVNSRHVKNVKGKKTDVVDCLWIQKLHSLGLLSGSFLLSDQLQSLRTYYAHRQYLIAQASRYIQKMQKALRLMNLRLDVVLNDITGKSGRAILDALLKGERDPQHLASLVHHRVKKSPEEIAASLTGHWREDLLFELRSCLALYDTYEKAIVQCDKKLEENLSAHAPTGCTEERVPQLPAKKQNKHSPTFNVRHLALAYLKTDLYAIPGISHNTVLCLLSNMGGDIRKFGSAKQFACWLRLVPNNKISGGRTISSQTPKGHSTLALALRQAANSIGNQKGHPLTPFFKRIAYRKGRNAAITATARKLAIIIWNMIVKQEGYKVGTYQLMTDKQKHRQIRNLRQRILRLHLEDNELKTLIQKPSVAST